MDSWSCLGCITFTTASFFFISQLALNSKRLRRVSRKRMASRRGHVAGKNGLPVRSQALFDDAQDVFGRGNQLLELAHIGVHIFMIEIMDHLRGHQPVQGCHVHHLAGHRIERPLDADFQKYNRARGRADYCICRKARDFRRPENCSECSRCEAANL